MMRILKYDGYNNNNNLPWMGGVAIRLVQEVGHIAPAGVVVLPEEEAGG